MTNEEKIESIKQSVTILQLIDKLAEVTTERNEKEKEYVELLASVVGKEKTSMRDKVDASWNDKVKRYMAVELPSDQAHDFYCQSEGEPLCPVVEKLIKERDAWIRLSGTAQRVIFKRIDERNTLRDFAKEVLNFGEYETARDIALKHGLLTMTRVTEPCGDGCACLRLYSAEFIKEGVNCYKETALLTGKTP